VISDLERDVGGAGKCLAEREVVVVLSQLGDRGLVGLGVQARQRDQALAKSPGLGGRARGLGPVLELRGARRELDQSGGARGPEGGERARAGPSPLGPGLEQLAQPQIEVRLVHQFAAKKNCFQADHQSSARETIVRSSTSSTPDWKRSFCGGDVPLYSTLISQGLPGSYGGTAFRSDSARFAPSSTSSRARFGVRIRAALAPSPSFTSTVVSPSPSSAFASRPAARSPVTSRTGQPQVPQSAALMPVSPTRVPLNHRFCQSTPETVWLRTPSAVPAIACMPTKSPASQPDSRKAV